MNNRFNRFLNIGLRSATLGTRFLFILFLARFLDPAMVGYYGLFTATVGYILYFVGMDFYTYATREILRSPMDQRGRMLKGQAALAGGLYLVVLPIALITLTKVGWPIFLIWWFAPILILEHFNQELSRVLISLSEQITASIVLFLRQGSWAIASVLLMASTPESRSLEPVLALWAAAGLAAAALGIWRLSRLKIGGWRAPVDWRWVRQGITISLGFLIATLALRATQTLDRYWLESLGGVEMLGAYVLFMGIASSMLTFLDAGVFAFTYPDLIRFNHQNEHAQARTLVRKSLLQTLAFAGLFSMVSWLILPYLLGWIGNPLYLSEIGLFPWILLAMTLNAIGMIPHYALYARGFDKPIIYSHIAAFVAFVIATWAFSRSATALAVPIGLNISFLLILLWKSSAYLHLIARDKATGAARSSS